MGGLKELAMGGVVIAGQIRIKKGWLIIFSTLEVTLFYHVPLLGPGPGKERTTKNEWRSDLQSPSLPQIKQQAPQQ